LTRNGYLMEEQGMTTLAESDPDLALAPLQAAACTYRNALGLKARARSAALANRPEPKRRSPRNYAMSTSTL